MKKLSALTLTGMVLMGALAGCGSNSSNVGDTNNGSAAASVSGAIDVVSREDGSGTRGAFIELFGIEEKNGDEKIDNTTADAIIANQTEVMMQNVSGDENAIGYASLGSLNDSVKAVKIDGAEATTENVLDGSYTISRPFNVATKGDLSEAAQDFMNYILSADGQQVVADNGYIPVSADAEKFTSNGASGDITVAGSSSVTPVMEKLKEAYEAVNSNVNITIQESDSTTGMTNAIEGVCDIGMASRELSEEELAELTPTQIALDGIAVIVNPSNPVDELTSAQVRSIFTGATTDWSEIG
ncbi:MAG: substrate-binding domain-containing protein [Clostridia bacterium]|nr:substrate-binding domain-containing protein [Clostridia bacterium]